MGPGTIDLGQMPPDPLDRVPTKKGSRAKKIPTASTSTSPTAPNPNLNPGPDPAPVNPLGPVSTNAYLPQTSHTDTQEPADPDLPFLSVSLPGESTDSVPIHDSCDELRRKIRAFFRNPRYAKVTQKRFREVVGNVNANTYRRFMEKKGESAGAESGMFYGSYVFFEKMRIYEGKGKGVRRVRSEVEFPHGRPMIDDNRRGVWVIGRAPVRRGGGGGRRMGWC